MTRHNQATAKPYRFNNENSECQLGGLFGPAACLSLPLSLSLSLSVNMASILVDSDFGSRSLLDTA